MPIRQDDKKKRRTEANGGQSSNATGGLEASDEQQPSALSSSSNLSSLVEVLDGWRVQVDHLHVRSHLAERNVAFNQRSAVVQVVAENNTLLICDKNIAVRCKGGSPFAEGSVLPGDLITFVESDEVSAEKPQDQSHMNAEEAQGGSSSFTFGEYVCMMHNEVDGVTTSVTDDERSLILVDLELQVARVAREFIVDLATAQPGLQQLAYVASQQTVRWRRVLQLPHTRPGRVANWAREPPRPATSGNNKNIHDAGFLHSDAGAQLVAQLLQHIIAFFVGVEKICRIDALFETLLWEFVASPLFVIGLVSVELRWAEGGDAVNSAPASRVLTMAFVDRLSQSLFAPFVPAWMADLHQHAIDGVVAFLALWNLRVASNGKPAQGFPGQVAVDRLSAAHSDYASARTKSSGQGGSSRLPYSAEEVMELRAMPQWRDIVEPHAFSVSVSDRVALLEAAALRALAERRLSTSVAELEAKVLFMAAEAVKYAILQPLAVTALTFCQRILRVHGDHELDDDYLDEEDGGASNFVPVASVSVAPNSTMTPLPLDNPRFVKNCASFGIPLFVHFKQSSRLMSGPSTHSGSATVLLVVRFSGAVYSFVAVLEDYGNKQHNVEFDEDAQQQGVAGRELFAIHIIEGAEFAHPLVRSSIALEPQHCGSSDSSVWILLPHAGTTQRFSSTSSEAWIGESPPLEHLLHLTSVLASAFSTMATPGIITLSRSSSMKSLIGSVLSDLTQTHPSALSSSSSSGAGTAQRERMMHAIQKASSSSTSGLTSLSAHQNEGVVILAQSQMPCRVIVGGSGTGKSVAAGALLSSLAMYRVASLAASSQQRLPILKHLASETSKAASMLRSSLVQQQQQQGLAFDSAPLLSAALQQAKEVSMLTADNQRDGPILCVCREAVAQTTEVLKCLHPDVKVVRLEEAMQNAAVRALRAPISVQTLVPEIQCTSAAVLKIMRQLALAQASESKTLVFSVLLEMVAQKHADEIFQMGRVERRLLLEQISSETGFQFVDDSSVSLREAEGRNDEALPDPGILCQAVPGGNATFFSSQATPALKRRTALYGSLSFLQLQPAQMLELLSVVAQEQQRMLTILCRRKLLHLQRLFAQHRDLVYLVTVAELGKAQLVSVPQHAAPHYSALLALWSPTLIAFDDITVSTMNVSAIPSGATFVTTMTKRPECLSWSQRQVPVSISIMEAVVTKEVDRSVGGGARLGGSAVAAQSKLVVARLTESMRVRNLQLASTLTTIAGEGTVVAPRSNGALNAQMTPLCSDFVCWTHAVPDAPMSDRAESRRLLTAAELAMAEFIQSRFAHERRRPSTSVAICVATAEDKHFAQVNFPQLSMVHCPGDSHDDVESDVVVVCGGIAALECLSQTRRGDGAADDGQKLDMWLWSRISRARHAVVLIAHCGVAHGARNIGPIWMRSIQAAENILAEEATSWLPHEAQSPAVLPLRCTQHPQFRQLATLVPGAPEKGEVSRVDVTGPQCTTVCLSKFKNCDVPDHACLRICHADARSAIYGEGVDGDVKSCEDDSHSHCDMPCQRKLPCDHPCPKPCGDSCGRCEFVDLVALPCGQRVISGYANNEITYRVFPHFQKLQCGSEPARCDELVAMPCGTCGADVTVACHESVAPITTCPNCETVAKRVTDALLAPGSAPVADKDIADKISKQLRVAFMKCNLMMQKTAIECARSSPEAANPKYVSEQAAHDKALQLRDTMLTAFLDRIAGSQRSVTDNIQRLLTTQVASNDEAEMDKKHMIYVSGRLKARQALTASRF